MPPSSEKQPAAAGAGEGPQSPAGGGGAANLKVAKDVLRHQQRLATPMPLGFVYKTLTTNLQSDKLMKDLVIFIPFLIVFVFFFLATRRIEEEFYFAQGLRDLMYTEELPPTSPEPGSNPNEITYYFKNYPGTAHERDWYDFLVQIISQQMFVPAGDSLPRRAMLGQVYPVGSMRIRSKHVTNTSCTANKHVFPTDNLLEYPRPCWGKFTEDNEYKGPLGKGDIWWNYTDEGCDGADGTWGSVTGRYGTYNCGGYVVDIPLTTSVDDAMAAFARIRDGGFAFSQTVRFVALEMIMYNAALDTFCNVKIFGEITEGAGWIPQQRFRPFHVSDNDGGWVVFTVFYLCFIVYFWVKMVREVMRHYRINRRIISYVFDIWNFLELVNNVVLLVQFAVYYVWWSKCNEVSVRFPTVNAQDIAAATAAAARVTGNATAPPIPPLRFTAEAPFPQQLNTIAEIFQVAIYLSSLNTVLLFLKIMKFLRLNNRLNILSRTMEAAAESILGVLVIFCWVVLSYTIAGNNIYGTGLAEFRNTDESFAALFRFLIGQFDYNALRSENRGLTFMFFWSFVIIGLFVLLNFIIAVVMNSFDAENDKQRPVPLDMAIRDTFSRLRRNLRAKGVVGIVLEWILTSNDGRLQEYIGTHITTLRISKEFESDNTTEDEDRIMEEIEAIQFRRKDLEHIIPKSEIDNIGEERVDNVWAELVAEYENTTLADEAVKVQQLKDSVFAAAVEGVTRVLVKHQRKLFGREDPDKASGSRRGSRSSSRTGSRSSTRRSSFVVKGSNSIRRKSDGAFDFGELNDGTNVVTTKQVKLGNGQTAGSAGDIIADISNRVAAVETRFARMDALLALMTAKVEQLQAK